ncbi:MAG: beta-galactosidase [Candidatus Moranbacteria bacterium]|nr:beta-galactosidase [Candidatus Moranbacteria bacterium]
MRHLLKIIGRVVLIIVTCTALLFGYFNLPGPAPREDVQLGMTFSSRYATDLGLDWKQTYLALLDEIGVKKLRLPVYWDLAEPKQGEYVWDDLDWQLKEAEKYQVEVILTIGQKVPRWPECHIPEWVGADSEKRQTALLYFMGRVVERYKSNQTVTMWQVENEPFLAFGICPPLDKNFLKQEVAFVKTLDPIRKVLLTDSGELSFWYGAASLGDVFGTTMYRRIWSPKVGGYFTYPIGPNFFRVKAFLINILAHQYNIMVIELQAEPWASGWIVDIPLEEQFRTMDETKLRENVKYAKQVGFGEVYLWGGEWWYWLKEKKNYPALWETGKELFREQR